MGTQTVILEGTQYVSDIPSVYYGATSNINNSLYGGEGDDRI